MVGGTPHSAKEVVMAGAVTRWDPIGEWADLRARFDRMVDEMAGRRDRPWTLPIDVIREGDKLVLRADLPGIKTEDVKIEVADDVLTVSGEHEERSEETEKDYVRRERRYGSFHRSLALPPGVEADKIAAQKHDGVLEVTIPLPKAGEKESVKITPVAG
jgi:HSP20 family protein